MGISYLVRYAHRPQIISHQVTGDKKEDAKITQSLYDTKIKQIVDASRVRYHEKYGDTIPGPNVKIGCK